MPRRQAIAAVALMALVLAGAASGGRDRNLANALAFVRARCPPLERAIDTSMWMHGVRFNALYGNCRAEDGTDQHIWFFINGRFVGTDTRNPSKGIFGLWRDDTTMAFMYVLYRARDPNCCPTGGGKIVRFRWTGKRVRALDAIPRAR